MSSESQGHIFFFTSRHYANGGTAPRRCCARRARVQERGCDGRKLLCVVLSTFDGNFALIAWFLCSLQAKASGSRNENTKTKYYNKEFIDVVNQYAECDDYAPDQRDYDAKTQSAVPGEVYFAVSRLLPDLKKLGGTSKTGPERVRQLATAGVPEPYECYRSIPVDDWLLVEKSMHEFFKEARVYPGKEFFLLSDEDVDKICDQIEGKLEMNEKERSNWTFAMHMVGKRLEKNRMSSTSLGKRRAANGCEDVDSSKQNKQPSTSTNLNKQLSRGPDEYIKHQQTETGAVYSYEVCSGIKQLRVDNEIIKEHLYYREKLQFKELCDNIAASQIQAVSGLTEGAIQAIQIAVRETKAVFESNIYQFGSVRDNVAQFKDKIMQITQDKKCDTQMQTVDYLFTDSPEISQSIQHLVMLKASDPEKLNASKTELIQMGQTARHPVIQAIENNKEMIRTAIRAAMKEISTAFAEFKQARLELMFKAVNSYSRKKFAQEEQRLHEEYLNGKPFAYNVFFRVGLQRQFEEWHGLIAAENAGLYGLTPTFQDESIPEVDRFIKLLEKWFAFLEDLWLHQFKEKLAALPAEMKENEGQLEREHAEEVEHWRRKLRDSIAAWRVELAENGVAKVVEHGGGKNTI